MPRRRRISRRRPGSRCRSTTRPKGPKLAIRVQELFGLDRHPAIAGGRVPLVVELLSPAHRPVQVTRDLPGFWRGSYAAVKAEMKGRYPRHPWPDDPLAAPPTRRAKPRGREGAAQSKHLNGISRLTEFGVTVDERPTAASLGRDWERMAEWLNPGPSRSARAPESFVMFACFSWRYSSGRRRSRRPDARPGEAHVSACGARHPRSQRRWPAVRHGRYGAHAGHRVARWPRPFPGRGARRRPPLDFMVDTGASQIALRESDAARLGIHPTPRDYSPSMSDRQRHRQGRAGRARPGRDRRHHGAQRRGAWCPRRGSEPNLLGMSFLSRV